MARKADRLAENAPGNVYVDSSCIDCATCRQIAPAVFERLGHDYSYVARQPANLEDTLRAGMALVACPTSSIGTEAKVDLTAAVAAFPEHIDGEIYYCGFASEKSYGASSYLIRRKGGNVLVDSPRAALPLMKRLETLGGLELMFLTHRDDVADHAAFHARFGCRRILHRRDSTAGVREIEWMIDGDDPVRVAEDLLAIPLPGHTRGSMGLLYADRYLFTGDHLWWSPERDALHASRDVCWHSWPQQTRSMERLLDYDFEWVLPGHGHRYRAPSSEQMRSQIERLIAAMRRQ